MHLKNNIQSTLTKDKNIFSLSNNSIQMLFTQINKISRNFARSSYSTILLRNHLEIVDQAVNNKITSKCITNTIYFSTSSNIKGKMTETQKDGQVRKDLSDMRKPYRDQDDGIEESKLPSKEPIGLFDNWFQMVKESGTVYEPNAFCICTASKDGQPSSRMVLLKGYGPEGFKFFTHYTSQKGRDIAENPKVAMLFYWDSFNRQVRIEGKAHKLNPEEGENYFKRRPQSSQIGAAISDQCSLIKSREALLKKYDDLKEELGDKSPPKPNTWGGYCVVPERFEFWQGNTNRVHDRIMFRRLKEGEKFDANLTKDVGDGWFMERMLP